MTSALENLTKGQDPGLKLEPPDGREFSGLVISGSRRLADAKLATLSLEGRFDAAYGASHSLCLAALRYRGFRPNNKRYIVFQVVPHTLGLGPEVWRVLARGHEVRNLGDYEGDLDVDQRLVTDLIGACEAVLQAIEKLPPLS